MNTVDERKKAPHMFFLIEAWLKKEYKDVLTHAPNMDILATNPNGTTCEIDVKMSRWDLWREFRNKMKANKHQAYIHEYNTKEGAYFCPTRFFFLVPSNLTQTVIKKLDKMQLPYGLIEYTKVTGEINLVRKSRVLTNQKYNRKDNIKLLD